MATVGNITTLFWGGLNAFSRGEAIFKNFSPAYEKQVDWLMGRFGMLAEDAVPLVYPYKHSSLSVKIQGFAIETLVEVGALFCIGAICERLRAKKVPPFAAIVLNVAQVAIQMGLTAIVTELFRDYLYIPYIIPRLVV